MNRFSISAMDISLILRLLTCFADFHYHIIQTLVYPTNFIVWIDG